MKLEVGVLYSISLDVGLCVEKVIQDLISEFENLVGFNVNNSKCLQLLGDIESFIDVLQWVEKGYLVSAVVLQKHEHEFKIDNLKQKASELNTKLHMPIYFVDKNYNELILALYFTVLNKSKSNYGEENIKIYFNAMIEALKHKNKGQH